MATLGDVPSLEFSGKDSDECDNFISAVMKLAFAQGKQRDDAWIADFVATCLTKDALRWWIKLDEETQGSWKLLRKAMDLEYQPSFQGGSGEEAEKFVQMVYRRARDAGKQGDNRWIMELVPTCLSGEALRWYASLDRTHRTEWDSFQQTAFAQYPREDGLNSHRSTSRIVPMPAAAAPVPQLPNGRRRGRISLTTISHSPQYYISKKINANGFFLLTNSLTDALEVELDNSYEDLNILYIPQNQVSGFDLVGIVWCLGDSTDPPNFAVVGPVNSRNNKWMERSLNFTGSVLTKIWRLTPGPPGSKDCRLSAILQNVNLFPVSGWSNTSVFLYTTPRERDAISFTFEAI